MPAGTIRVAKAITTLLNPAVREPSAPDVTDLLEQGAPCSGRCGHCNHHPCRLHGGI